MATQQYTGSRTKNKRRHLDTDTISSSDDECTSQLNVDSWPRFLVVDGVDGAPLKINPFIVSKALEGICGDVKNVTRLRNGSLLVECSKRQQSINLLNAHHFGNVEIAVSIHKYLNSCRGIIRDRARCLSDMSEEEITVELKSQGVTSVKRFTRKDNDRIVPTTTYLLTFACPKVPTSIKAGYFNIGVDVYIPNPLRCFKCQKFGHGAKSCDKSPVCSRCSKSHDSADCTDVIHCANCSGEHLSSSKSCPFYLKQSQLLKIKYTNNVSFSDAMKLLAQQTPNTPSSLSYSAAVATSTRKVDCACQTDISWVSDKQSVLPPVPRYSNDSSSSASQTELQSESVPVSEAVPVPLAVPVTVPKPETVREVPNTKHLTNKEKKQLKKKELRALKQVEVPSPLIIPVEVHNTFEPLAMEVTPSLALQRRGPSPRSRSPIEPP
ncbi:uncharacterized protein LOC125382710 [Haliotis rufescens]|uniref:uncharacterized protein LOC125382710 n=1 Tax=Haliotis rufescens TaxID=6454 RepID=UPI00201F43D1|nr:uncharacterized protein LOC125382710 [Haliotis rufescens]